MFASNIPVEGGLQSLDLLGRSYRSFAEYIIRYLMLSAVTESGTAGQAVPDRQTYRHGLSVGYH